MPDKYELFLDKNKKVKLSANEQGDLFAEANGKAIKLGVDGLQAIADDGSLEAIGGGGVQGTGTTNRIPVFTDEGTIGDSNIFANDERVQISSSSFDGSVPAELLISNYGTFNTFEPACKINLTYGFGSNFSIYTEEHPAIVSYPDLVIEGGQQAQFNQEFFRISSLENSVTIGSTTEANSYMRFSGMNGTLGVIQQNSANAANIRLESASKEVMEFVNISDFGTVGSISIDGTSTSYNTASDYRLKEDFQPISNSLDKLDALKPINFAWKNGGKRVDGFLAHEVAEVIPEAVTGEKDGTEEYTIKEEIKDREGNIIQEAEIGVRNAYQAIDQSKIVPLLTAALQEANQLIKDLTARVEVLENK